MQIPKSRASDLIFAELRRRITAKEWPDGAQLPTERELALEFGVSPNTVREATRALGAIGLVEVRHGSGAYISLSSSRILSSTLGTLMQLENVGLADVLALNRHLHQRLTRLAVERATDEDVERLEQALGTVVAENASLNAQQVAKFLDALAAAAHDPLLAGICWALDRAIVQSVSLVYADRPDELVEELRAIWEIRRAMVVALRRRDVTAMLAATNAYFDASEALTRSRSELDQVRLTDAEWANILGDLAADYSARSHTR